MIDEITWLYKSAITGAVGVIGWFVKTLHADVKNMKQELSDHKQHVAENYTTNAKFDKIENKLDKIYDILIKKE